MLVVVEGVSASGKSSWCKRNYPLQTIGEPPPAREAEEALAPHERQAYWAERGCTRWNAGVGLEQTSGLAVFDTDPFKLHYTWSLLRLGLLDVEEWLTAVDVCRAAFADGRLGLADLVLVADAPPEELSRRREADKTLGRERRRFDLHMRMREPLREWYGALARLDPRRVCWSLPPDGSLPEVEPRDQRSGLPLFEAVRRGLPLNAADDASRA